ncbi:MAG: alkaline phosphatase family protein, partial [Mycobacterium sp.]
VYMVYMENKGYSSIVGSPNAPFLNSLINAYGFADNYYALTHGSLPNYYPIVGGTDFNITYNCASPCIDATTTLVSNIDDAGKTWRSYAQSLEQGSSPLESSGDYAVDETPFPAFTSIANDPAYAAAHIVPLEQMAIDLQSAATAPDFAWFAANEDFNGEGPVDFPWGMLKFAFSQITPGHQYNVPALDQFLSENVPTILNSNAWKSDESSVLVVTFDEDNNNTSLGFGNEGNHVVTVVIPNQAAIDAGMKAGHFVATDHYNHYSLLRMIEDSLGLPTLTDNDKYAASMNEFWDGTVRSGPGPVVL